MELLIAKDPLYCMITEIFEVSLSLIWAYMSADPNTKPKSNKHTT